MGCVTYHGVHAEMAEQIGGRLPAEHVVESRALERVAGVQVDDGWPHAVRGHPGPFDIQRAAQPGETAVAAGRAAPAAVIPATAASLVVVCVQVVGVQDGQPELAGSGRHRRHRHRGHLKQSQRYGRHRCTAQRSAAVKAITKSDSLRALPVSYHKVFLFRFILRWNYT